MFLPNLPIFMPSLFLVDPLLLLVLSSHSRFKFWLGSELKVTGDVEIGFCL